ncbi:MAG: hypothetical protein COA58_07010 [Bacteroidetes bacterium]|nr:MAG: hypothetical protein COA58_07010 [Bacteroidota bacterium]
MKKHYTPKRLLTGVILITMLCMTTVSLTNSGGAGGGNTNAPGENNCTQCHSGTLQTVGSSTYNNISFSSNFTGNGYIPDSVYTITFSYTHSGKSKFGYQMTCLEQSNNAMAGSFSLISGNNKSSITTATIGGAGRSYMRHTSSGNSGSGAITWSFKWTAPSSNVDTVVFYSIVNSTNSGGSTAGDIITERQFKIGPSTLLPTASSSASNTNPCQSSLVNFTGSGTNSPISYSWSLVGASPSMSNVQNPSAVYNFPGTYRAILTTTNAKGVSSPDTTIIVVKSAPSAFIFGGATRTICEGDSVQLSTSFGATNSYSWNKGGSGNSIWAKDTGDYFVSVSSTNGCEKVSNTVHVSFYTKPVGTLTSDASVFSDSSCAGSAIELEATAGFDSFYYYENGSLIASTDSNKQMVSFNATTTYGVQVRNSNGCLSDTTFYTVEARDKMDAPIINCTATTASSIEFSWTSVGAHMGYQVSLNNGTTWISPSSGAAGTTHLTSGLQPEDSVTLLVRAIDNAPCDYSLVGSKKCFSESCVQLNATANAVDSICKGDLWRVEINGLNGESYGLSLDGGMVFTDTIFEFNPTITGTYLVMVTDSNNLVCPALPIQIPLVVDDIHDIELKTDKIGSYCEGENITFSANDSIENFDFYYNQSLVQSSASNTYENSSMSNNDSVFVVVSKGKCTDTSQMNYVQIELPANASFTNSRDRSTYTFVPDNSTYSSYTWDFGDGSATSNDVSPVHDYASDEGQNVNVSLEVVTANNCVNDSTESINLPLFSNVKELQLLGLEVYPNPVGDILQLKNTSSKPMKISIISISGELLMERTLGVDFTSISVNHLDAGIYILQVISDGKESSMRIIKK